MGVWRARFADAVGPVCSHLVDRVVRDAVSAAFTLSCHRHRPFSRCVAYLSSVSLLWQNYCGFTKAESMPDRECVWPMLLPVLDVVVSLLDSYHCLGPVSRACLSYFQAFIEAHVRGLSALNRRCVCERARVGVSRWRH